MLEKPDLDDARIVRCLRDEYGLPAARITFLPVGADQNTAAYRLAAAAGTAHFLKLRAGPFDETSVLLPRFLADHGIPGIIAPLPARDGRLWARVDGFRTILYPFVPGRDGYQVDLSDQHWRALGAALKRVHTLALPPALRRRIRRETYDPRWRQGLSTTLARLGQDPLPDAIAGRLVAFLHPRQDQILDLVARAERLAFDLVRRAPDPVLCHSDLHAGNVLVAEDGALYIVDWDEPILAPRERDLMYPGGAQGFRGHTPQEEEILFYEGYGPASIDDAALAYYRYERIVTDLAIFCEQLLSTAAGGQDREQSLQYLKSNFLPNGTIEVAYRSDRTRGQARQPVGERS